jgi:hypothetical protein
VKWKFAFWVQQRNIAFENKLFASGTNMFKHFYEKPNFATGYLHLKSTQRRLCREMGEGEQM